MGVSIHGGNPKSSILIGFPLKTIPFGVPQFLGINKYPLRYLPAFLPAFLMD